MERYSTGRRRSCSWRPYSSALHAEASACRSVTTLALVVNKDTLHAGFWLLRTPPRQMGIGCVRLRARRVWWNSTTSADMTRLIHAIADATDMYFCAGFVDSLKSIRWPCRLKKLEFDLDSKFDRRIDGVTWPASLQDIEFGENFDQSISGVRWPASLQRLKFGNVFDQPIEETE